ncbi:hypothetical protein BKI51_07150 [Alphaproteobacteria bacterium AO1-B]|nr:hypothetical protein BKI51_07150 [Alphaproteobacteria bacterium AO1-B]
MIPNGMDIFAYLCPTVIPIQPTNDLISLVIQGSSENIARSIIPKDEYFFVHLSVSRGRIRQEYK